MTTQLIVVGGGITGLAAAWEAQKTLGDDYILVESGPRLGGKISTVRRPDPDGRGEFVVDGGPESFVTRKPELTQLAEELGIAEDLIDPGAESSGMYVLTDGRPQRVPTTPGSFVCSRLLSVGGKARFLAEPFVRPRRDVADESLASFVTRRLGRQAYERMFGPVLGGIYQANPEVQSIQVTAPVMQEMEREHGSLFRAALARGRAKRRKPGRYPAFVSFPQGTQPLVDSLAVQLSGRILTGSAAARVRPETDGFTVTLASGEVLTTKTVILACPAAAAAAMLDHRVADSLQELRTTDIGTATLIYRGEELGALADIRGCMVPAREGRRVDAVMVTSQRMPARSMPGFTMVRVIFGSNDPSLVGLPDSELLPALATELADLFGVKATPEAIVSFHWPQGYPQAEVGHLARLDAIESQLPAGLALAGSPYRGVGVPDCIRQGQAAARRLLIKEHA